MAEHPDDQQLKTWGTSTRGHERVAVAVATWARGKPKWTMAPAPEALGIEAPPGAFTKALNMLVRLGVLANDGHDYFVAIDPAAPSGTSGRPEADQP
jgi:hypothetical protein